MKNKGNRIWDHIDAGDNAEAKAALEAQLGQDESLRVELAKSRKLHEELGKMEAEQPSMRFTQNLMDRLPQLYRRIPFKPLVSKPWVQAYLIGFSLCLLVLFGFGWLTSASSLIAIDLPLEEYSLQIGASFPFRMVIILTGVAFAVLYLIWLDKRLKKRFE